MQKARREAKDIFGFAHYIRIIFCLGPKRFFLERGEDVRVGGFMYSPSKAKTRIPELENIE